jgi:hypothetical protein
MNLSRWLSRYFIILHNKYELVFVVIILALEMLVFCNLLYQRPSRRWLFDLILSRTFLEWTLPLSFKLLVESPKQAESPDHVNKKDY